MEPSDTVSSNFNILYCDYDNILKNTEAIYPAVLKVLSDSTDVSSISYALKIALGPCLSLFTLDDLEEKLWKYVCPCARKILLQALEFSENPDMNCGKNLDKNFLIISEEIVSVLVDCMSHIAAKYQTLELHNVRSLLTCSSEILLLSYQYSIKQEGFNNVCNTDSDDSGNIVSFLNKTQKLQENLLKLLSVVNIKNEQCDIDTLDLTLSYIYKCSIVSFDLDVKTMADILIGYTKITGMYAEYLKTYHDISTPIQWLCKNLKKNLENFFSVGDFDSQKYDKTIKILCFILKVIIKLTEKFSGYLRNCHDSFVNLLFTLIKFTEPYSKINQLPNQNVDGFKHLVIGIDPLLNLLLNDEEFVHEFFLAAEKVQMDSTKRLVFLLLSCMILKKLSFSDHCTRKIWYNSDVNIVKWMFQITALCNFELLQDIRFPGILVPGKAKKTCDYFEYLLTHIATFLLITSSKNFFVAENILFKYVLQPNPWCSLLAADIWCLLLRFADAELCYNQLVHLCKILNEVRQLPLLPEVLFLESLMARLFLLLSQKQRDSLPELYPPEEFGNLWRLFDTQYLSTNVLTSIKTSINSLEISNIHRFLYEEELLKSDFMKLEWTLYGSNLNCKKENNDLEDCIKKLWKFNASKLVWNPLGGRYLKSLIVSTCGILPFMTSKCLLSVLQAVSGLLSNLNPTSRLHCLDLISLSGKIRPEGSLEISTIRIIASLFNRYLRDDNSFIRTKSVELFSDCATVTSHTQIVTLTVSNDYELQTRVASYLQRKHFMKNNGNFNDFFKKIANIIYKHVCDVESTLMYDDDLSEPPSKKANLYNSSAEENMNLDNKICLMKTEAIRISQSGIALSCAQKKELLFITDLLKTLQ